MSKENITVKIDTAAPVAAKIESVAAEYNGKYKVNDDVYNRFIDVYRKFRKFAVQNDGGIRSVDVRNVERAKIVAEVPDVDSYKEGLSLFSTLLGEIDSMDIHATGGEYLVVEVGVAGLWKAV